MHRIMLGGMALAFAMPAMAQDCPPASDVAKHQVLPVLRRTGDFSANGATLLLGQPTDLLLAPAGKILSTAPLHKPLAADDTGGIVRFRAGVSGIYRVALGGHAWIDVVQGATSLASVAHAPGTPCSGIAKMVDFKLAAGDYTLQLSGTQAPSMTVTVSLLP